MIFIHNPESSTNQAETCEILQQMITDNDWKR
jgi:hypothetical protein